MTIRLRAVRRWCRPTFVLALVVLVGLCLGHGVPARAAEDWRALTTTVFRSVGDVSGTSVTAVAEDGDGYLWVGGQSGLSRWDGYRFRPFVPDPQVPGSLPDTYVNVLHTDRRGRLWIGTNCGGLSRYDRGTDRFVTFAAGRAGPSSNYVDALADDADDGLWIGTNRGLDHLLGRSGTFEHFRHDPRRPGTLPGDIVYAVLRDDLGTLWVATDGGLVRRDPGSTRFVPVDLPTTDGERAIGSALFEDSARRLWIGTIRHGVFMAGPAHRHARVARVPVTGRAADLFTTQHIAAINEVRGGEIWFGTDANGLIELETATLQTRWMVNDPAVPTSLPQNSVFAIYRDRAGLVWVGTLGGLRRSDPRQTGISTIMVGSNRSAGIAKSDVTAIFAADDDHTWIGFGGGGLDIVDPVHGHVATVHPDRTHPGTSLPEAAVRALAGLPAGPVFIGTDRGLYRAERDGRNIRPIAMPNGGRDDVVALCFADDVLWIGTAAHGIWRLEVRDGKPVGAVRPLEHTGLTDNRITALSAGPPGYLWVGTYSGLSRLAIGSERVERITLASRGPTHQASVLVASLLTDRRGRLWVGTFGGGIEILDHVHARGRADVVQLSGRQGLPNINVDAMLTDRHGRIWVATDDGLAVVDPATLEVRALHRADGVELSGYFVGSAAELGNGEIVLGSTGGVTIVRPSFVRGWTYVPPVVVTDVRVGGKTIPPSAFASSNAAPIEITPQANTIAVEFAALDFSAPDQNRYAYRLDGFDSDWTETDPMRRLAAYTNLPPGQYTLELRGSNRNGVWSASTVTLPIRVLPAWHQTLAVRLLEIALVAAALVGSSQIRTSYLRRRERDLANQVSERTAELEALAVELRRSKEQLEQIAYRDVLTDLPNRRMFNEAFEQMLAPTEARTRGVALLLIDLDEFKLVNDDLGHDAGDALLVEAARRLRSVVRASDMVARLGGDEFAILLPDEPSDATIDRVCGRVIAAFVAPVAFNGIMMKTTASVGIAVYPVHGTTQDRLYKSADIALYEAKRAGRNTWRRFELAPT